MRKRPRQRFDHGQPVSKIDTRPLAFVAMFLAIVFLMPAAQVRPHSFAVELWDGEDVHPLIAQRGEPVVFEHEFTNRLTVSSDGALWWNGYIISEAGLVQLLRDNEELLKTGMLEFEPEPNASYDKAVKVLYIVQSSGAPFQITGTSDHCEFGKGDIPSPAQRQFTGNVSTAHILGNMGLTIALPPEPSGKLYEFTQVFEPCEPRLLVHTPR